MRLGVNIDHVATLRQARGAAKPDPLEAARICRVLGVHAVVMHLREDRRHIQDADLFRLREKVPIRLNLEMSVHPSVVKVALKLLPDQATLVPEKRKEKTTEGGLDLFRNKKSVQRVVRALGAAGVHSSLFIDPDPRQVDAAKKMGSEAVEFHTGHYANAQDARERKAEFLKIRKNVELARAAGLSAYAGHGLDYDNVRAIATIQGLEELNIGYSIVTRALWVGFETAVKEMQALL